MNAWSNREGSGRVAGAVRLAAAGLMWMALTAVFGCGGDNRISIDEFMRVQQAATEAPPVAGGMFVAATQPTGEAPATQPVDQYWGPYRIGPGDVLTVVLSGIEQTGVVAPIQARVSRDGTIQLPLVEQPIPIQGLELSEAEDTIRRTYVPSVYRQASVHVQLARPEMVSVLVAGAVAQPGLVQLPRTQRNLLFAIAGAGGVSQLASGEVVLRRLRTQEETRYNLLMPGQLQQVLTSAPLLNGDVVIVQAAAPNVIFIGGLVQAPHQQVNPPGTEMNILQAIASAGGVRTDVTPSEITLIRRLPDGKDIHVKLDLDRIQKGKDPNVVLAPGDIVWVPETLLTKAQDWANRNLFIRAGASAIVTYNVTGLDFINSNAERATFGTGGDLEDRFDPFGFLIRDQQLQNINNQLPPPVP